MTDKLVERLRFLVSLDHPKYGGPYGGSAASECMRSMNEAASALEAQQARIRELEKLAGDNTTLFVVLADIRQQSGVGIKPMLSELAQAIGARIRELENFVQSFRHAAEAAAEGAGSLPAKHAVKLEPDRWHRILDLSSRAKQVLGGG